MGLVTKNIETYPLDRMKKKHTEPEEQIEQYG